MTNPRTRTPAAIAVALVLASMLGCDEPSAQSTHQTAALQLSHASSKTVATDRNLAAFPAEMVLPWGQDDGQVGMVPAANDRPPFGPLAAAVGPGGGVFVLDQVNDRVVELSASGQWVGWRPCPPAPSDLVVDAQGRVVALSLVNHRVSVVETDGAGEQLGFPAVLPLIGGLELAPTGELMLANGRQETFLIGVPGAWIGWPDLLKTRREGHGDHAGGQPRQVMLREGQAWVLNPVGHKKPTEIALQGSAQVASVALLASYPDGSVAVVLERWVGDGGRVARTLARYDAQGALLNELAVSSDLLTFPHREFVTDDDGAVLQLLPMADGLHLRVHHTGAVERAGGAS